MAIDIITTIVSIGALLGSFAFVFVYPNSATGLMDRVIQSIDLLYKTFGIAFVIIAATLAYISRKCVAQLGLLVCSLPPKGRMGRLASSESPNIPRVRGFGSAIIYGFALFNIILFSSFVVLLFYPIKVKPWNLLADIEQLARYIVLLGLLIPLFETVVLVALFHLIRRISSLLVTAVVVGLIFGLYHGITNYPQQMPSMWIAFSLFAILCERLRSSSQFILFTNLYLVHSMVNILSISLYWLRDTLRDYYALLFVVTSQS